MKRFIAKSKPGLSLPLLACLTVLASASAPGQLVPPGPGFMPPPPISGLSPRDTQRNALQAVMGEVNWFRNATRTAPNLVNGGYDSLVQRFQMLRTQYNTFKTTLKPAQLNQGGNELSELDAGLDIIQEAFVDFEAAATAARVNRSSFLRLCRVLDQAVAEWGRELDRVSRRLRVGW